MSSGDNSTDAATNRSQSERIIISGRNIKENDKTLAIIGLQYSRGFPEGNKLVESIMHQCWEDNKLDKDFPVTKHAISVLSNTHLQGMRYCKAVHIEEGKITRKKAGGQNWTENNFELFEWEYDNTYLKKWFVQYLKTMKNNIKSQDPNPRPSKQPREESLNFSGIFEPDLINTGGSFFDFGGLSDLTNSETSSLKRKERGELKNLILESQNMIDLKFKIYPDRRFQNILERLEAAQEFVDLSERSSDISAAQRHRMKWAFIWAIDRDYGMSPVAKEKADDFDDDRSLIKSLILAMMDRVSGGLISPAEVVGFRDQIHRILTVMLPMDRFQALMRLYDSTQNKRGKHWYASAHTEMMVRVTNDETLRSKHTMNKRFLALFEIEGIDLEDLKHYLLPTLTPLIQYSQKTLDAVAEENAMTQKIITVEPIKFDRERYDPKLQYLWPPS